MEEKMISYMKLEDILFQYERQTAPIDVLQMLIADGPVDIVGQSENAMEYSLYEIVVRMQEINQKLRELIRSRALPERGEREG